MPMVSMLQGASWSGHTHRIGLGVRLALLLHVDEPQAHIEALTPSPKAWA